jgi:hypothetical protein
MNTETTSTLQQQKTKQMYLRNPLVNRNGSVTPRPCTTTDLALVYGVDRRTIANWLKPFADEIGKRNTYYFTQKQVEVIFEKLGKPKELEFECIL